jgi:hypothetical protein
MATTSKVLFRGAAATSSTTLYTTPASTTAVITNIAITNGAASSATFTLLLNDIELQKDTTVAANSTIYVDLKQVLPTTHTIKGLASATTVDFHISGVEIA